MRLYVYALTGPEPLIPARRGIAGERLTLVPAGPVAAVVGRIGRAPRNTAATLRRYDAAIRRLHAERAALLPVRFGTTFDDAGELLLVLRSRRGSLRRALALVRRRAQMTIRVLTADGRTKGDLRRPRGGAGVKRSAAGASPAAAVTGATYLRALALDAAAERHVHGFDGIRGAVSRWVRAERVEKHGALASVYHLVPRGSAAAYRHAAERAAAASAVRIVVSGPWPPYAFAGW